MWQEQNMQCEHLHPGTNSQKPAELAWEHVSGSSLVGARRRHHVALLEKVLQISSSDVLFRSTEKRRSTPERSSNHHSKDSRTPSSLHPPAAATSRVPGTPLGARRGLPWEVAPPQPCPCHGPTTSRVWGLLCLGFSTYKCRQDAGSCHHPGICSEVESFEISLVAVSVSRAAITKHHRLGGFKSRN